MRTIDRSSAFKRDYKRESKSQHRATLDDTLKPVLIALTTDQPLDARHRDHAFPAIGRATGSATSSPTCCGSTASPIPTPYDLRGLDRTANFSADAPDSTIKSDHLHTKSRGSLTKVLAATI